MAATHSVGLQLSLSCRKHTSVTSADYWWAELRALCVCYDWMCFFVVIEMDV